MGARQGRWRDYAPVPASAYRSDGHATSHRDREPRESHEEKIMSKKLYSAELVHLSISNDIDPALIASAMMSDGSGVDVIAAAKGRMADALAAFLVTHMTTVSKADKGVTRVSVKVTVVMAEAPENIPATKILFYERKIR